MYFMQNGSRLTIENSDSYVRLETTTNKKKVHQQRFTRVKIVTELHNTIILNLFNAPCYENYERSEAINKNFINGVKRFNSGIVFS